MGWHRWTPVRFMRKATEYREVTCNAKPQEQTLPEVNMYIQHVFHDRISWSSSFTQRPRVGVAGKCRAALSYNFRVLQGNSTRNFHTSYSNSRRGSAREARLGYVPTSTLHRNTESHTGVPMLGAVTPNSVKYSLRYLGHLMIYPTHSTFP